MEECQRLGDYLRERRLEKGLSLEDVSSRTKIQPHYLQALDEGLYDRLPAEIYLKGFLISYAEVLDVPSAKLLELYRSDCPDKKPIDLRPPEPIKTYGMGDHANRNGLRLGILFLLIVLIVAGLWWFSADDSSEVVETVREEQPAEVKMEKAPVESPAPAAEPVADEPVIDKPVKDTETPQEPAEVEELPPVKEEPVSPQDVDIPEKEVKIEEKTKPQPVKQSEAVIVLPAVVELKAVGTVAVEVEIDGRPLQSYSLQPGSLMRWRVKETIDLKIAPPQGAEAFIGDVRIPLDEEGRFFYSSND